MIKIATPVSELFSDVKVAGEIIDISDCLEIRDLNITKTFPKEELYHSDIQPIHEIGEEGLDTLAFVKKNKPGIKCITFHAASCFKHPKVNGYMFDVGELKYTRQQMVNNFSGNMSKIKDLFEGKMLFGIENTNYYPTEAYEIITEPDFLSELCEQTGIAFLFDISHAKISAFNKGLSYDEYVKGLPLGKTIQIHISSYAFDGSIAYDAHEIPGDEVLSCVKDLQMKCPNLEYATIEYYKNCDKLVSSIRGLKEILK